MSQIDLVLNILSDGKYHFFDEIKSKADRLNPTQVECLLIFLSRFGLVKRLRPRWRLQ